jgi:hypothetical protein
MPNDRFAGFILLFAGAAMLVPPVILLLVPVVVETWGFGGVGYVGGFKAMAGWLLLLFLGGGALLAGIWLLTARPRK